MSNADRHDQSEATGTQNKSQPSQPQTGPKAGQAGKAAGEAAPERDAQRQKPAAAPQSRRDGPQ